MAKARKQKVERPKLPRFSIGTVISTPSLVVDGNGVSWWVDPFKGTVARVEPAKA